MTSNRKTNPYFIFGLLILIFLGPLVAATLLYELHPDWLTKNKINRGQFISPPLDFYNLNKKVSFKSNRQNPWQVFYLLETDCTQLCKKRLRLLEYAILALGKKNQVTLSLIQVNKFSKIRKTNIDYYLITNNEYQSFFARKKMREGYYIVDPRGKVILYYPANTPNKNLYKDLSRLI